VFRFLYVTDLHGWAEGYELTLEMARREKIPAIVNGGDMLPHAKDLIFTQRLFLEEYLEPYCRLVQSYGIQYYAMLGNDDCKAVLPSWIELVHGIPCLHDLTEEWVNLDSGLRIRGCNYVPDPPFRLKDWSVLDTRDYVRPDQPPKPLVSDNGDFQEIDDIETFFQKRPTLEEMLNSLSCPVEPMDQAILVCHAPPASTELGMIDSDVDVGSKAVRNWIESRQPLLTLHGHIHENFLITQQHTRLTGRL
jgi:Icc-related predicted phosphoesterase